MDRHDDRADGDDEEKDQERGLPPRPVLVLEEVHGASSEQPVRGRVADARGATACRLSLSRIAIRPFPAL
jgi:hypothetical protein